MGLGLQGAFAADALLKMLAEREVERRAQAELQLAQQRDARAAQQQTFEQNRLTQNDALNRQLLGREAAMQTFNLRNGLPAADQPGTYEHQINPAAVQEGIGAAPVAQQGFAPGQLAQPAPGVLPVRKMIQPVTIPGIAGQPTIDLTPRTAEDTLRAEDQAQRIKDQRNIALKAMEPYNLPEGEKRFMGGTVIASNPKAATRKVEPTLVGPDGTPPFVDDAGHFWDQAGQQIAPGQVRKAPTPRDPSLETLTNLQIQNLQQQGASQATDADYVTFANLVRAGKMAPSQAAAMLGGFGQRGIEAKQRITREIIRQDPNFNFEQAEAGYQYAKSPGVQTTVRMIDNISKTLPVLEQASDDFARTNVRSINAALKSGKSQFGNTDVVKFDFARTMLADEIAKILQGGGTGNSTSDAKLKQASDLLSGDLTPAQLKSATAIARELLNTRRDSLTGGTFMQSAPADTGTKPSAADLIKKYGGG